VRERERPEPSVIWQTLAITFFGFGFATGLAAMTMSDKLAVKSVDLWIGTAGLLLAAAICLVAHRDVNRGRRSKLIEVEELPLASGDSRRNRHAG
jgi:hypothetical protein